MDNMNMPKLDLASIYGIPPCPGGDCTNSPNIKVPSLEQIAGYNLEGQTSMNAQKGQGQGTNQVQNSTSPIIPATEPQQIPGQSLQYLNGFLRTQIGRTVTVDFLIGTNTLVDKTGKLLAVGTNYILINETQTDDILACDFYNIKFVKFYY